VQFHSVTGAAVTFAAAGFIVAGCSSSSSSSSATTPAASSAATAGSAAQAGSPSASPSSSQPAQAAGSATCQATSLSYALGAATGTSAQRTQIVNLTNKGTSACTLDGFPGVNLTGTANGKPGFTWSLVRQSASYSTVTLQPGQSAHFGLVYLPGTSASTDIAVTSLVVTPPNDYTHAEVTWKQSVVLQDGATHPGTYITPVTAGS
jgi:Protein of unknown function (DUF4232)